MAVFTRVTEAELNAWLKDYSVGEVLALQGVASGIENTNYFLTTSQGRFVLTLFEKLAAAELPFYLNLMDHLVRRNVPCPRPVANRHQRFLGELNGKPACIVSRLAGKSVMQAAIAHCMAVGSMLGKMHVAAQGFAETMPNARAASWRMETAKQVMPYLSAANAYMLQQEIALHARQSLENLPQGLIHADLFRDNVLFEGTQIGGVIDFYFACNDSLLYDVAITVNDWCMGAQGMLDIPRAQALLRAYRAERPFTPAEAGAWPQALRLAALRFWLSRLHDLHLPRDGELVNTHDPEQFRQILYQYSVTAPPPLND